MNNQCQSPLVQCDQEIFDAINREKKRQQNQVELIASENFTSLAVMAAQGSVLTNKYAEGYPGKRYYGGCVHVDTVEQLAIDRARQLYNCEYANVQPHSGAQANQAVFIALLKPGETFLGMDLNSGGHLTHGCKVNMSGKWFHAVGYGVDPISGLIDMAEVERLAHEHKPKIIIAGGSAYPRHIDFAGFRCIADAVGAYLMVDMAHFSGLVAGGAFPSPLPHAHVVTTTTHKTLRGPRGGMILAQTNDLAKQLNSAVFPGNQGGPLMHVIAAKAVAFKEALDPSFKNYAQQIVNNARALGKVLKDRGLRLVTDGTDCHLILVDLTSTSWTGAEACELLEQAGITCNKNSIPNDPLPPLKTSGIRLGTPACTTRGFKENEFQQVGKHIADVLQCSVNQRSLQIEQTRQHMESLCQRFPLYPTLGETTF